MLLNVNQHFWTTFSQTSQNKLLKVECAYLKFPSICLLFVKPKILNAFSDAKTKLIRNMRHFGPKNFLFDLDNELSSLSQESSSKSNTASVH